MTKVIYLPPVYNSKKIHEGFAEIIRIMEEEKKKEMKEE